MGIYIRNLTPLEAQRLGLTVDYGVLVADIEAGGPASKAGIKPMDVIIALEGKKVADSSELQDTLYQYKVGQTIKVTLIRDKQELTLDVTLEALP